MRTEAALIVDYVLGSTISTLRVLSLFLFILMSYITPADIQHRARVHLLSFRDRLAVILNLPASHLTTKSIIEKY